MKIATHNVNSVRARLPRVLAWLERTRPDVVCLQELKAREKDLPLDALNGAGYHVTALGQKTYNGVAILSLQPPTDVLRGFDDEQPEDPQARLVAATVGGVRVLSAYFPNGAEPSSDKYLYKQAWLDRLQAYLEQRCDPTTPLVLAGDFNIASDERDATRPEAWEGTVLYNPVMRARLARLLRWGFVDTFRMHQPEPGHYTWWDYRAASFRRNEGLRIDYLLATRSLAARCVAAGIDKEERAGTKPSDHAPVWAEFEARRPPAEAGHGQKSHTDGSEAPA